MPIVVLNAHTINKIAAGEVIDCPASVVKELVENSIDAGAKTITVRVDEGGRNLIHVSDDGCGMTSDEMEKAFVCHATSKLLDDDLTNIRFMGFRGEGLTSIAAISRVKMASKHRDADRAWTVTFEGGCKTKDLTPEALPCGTSIEVRDLFFATPTRLKFLRTEKAEIQNIVDLLNRLAMINHDISFSLTVGDRQVFKYPVCENLADRLRGMKAFGDAFLDHALEISHTADYLQVYGYASLPTFNRAKPGMLHTFVNNRPIHSPLLVGAIKSAYSGFIPKDRYPVVVLSLKISPMYVDVNVHPSKQEVRFQDKKFVFGVVSDILKNAMSRSVYARFTGGEDSANYGCDHFVINNYEQTYGLVADSQGSTSQNDGHSVHLHDDVQIDVRPAPCDHVSEKQQSSFDNLDCTSHEHAHTHASSKGNAACRDKKDRQVCAFPSDEPLGNAVCQLFERYIVSQAKDYAVIVDQHAAHERLKYEYIRRVMEEDGILRQVLLMPEFVELANEYEFELLSEYKDRLLKLGLVIELMGGLVVVVREVPAIFGVIDAKALIFKIVESIMEVGDALFLKEKIAHICGTIACYGSIRSGRVMKIEEMNSLLRKMESTPHSGQCNHGRPTYIKLSLSQIDRLFERT